MAQKHAKHAEAAQEVMGPVTDAVVPHFAPKVVITLNIPTTIIIIITLT